MITHHAYPVRKLLPDYLRAALGTGICLAPLAGGFPMSVGLWVVLGLATVFALFGLRTAARQIQRVQLAADGILVTGVRRKEIAWDKLDHVSLAYFSTWRNKTGGWMQLKLKGEGQTLRLESSLTGFREVARRAEAAGRANQLTMDKTTRRNFEALDLALSEDRPGALERDRTTS